MSDVHIKATIAGVQAVQTSLVKAAALTEPDGPAAQITKYVTVGLHRYAVAYTHVDTGTLRASQSLRVEGLRGVVYVGDGVNPRTKQKASYYAPFEHARGGEHAFYDRAVAHADELINDAAARYLS